MNKKTILKKKHGKKLSPILDMPTERIVTEDEARRAWNTLAVYLNKRPELSFDIRNERKRLSFEDFFGPDQMRYTLAVLAGEEIFVADTCHNFKLKEERNV